MSVTSISKKIYFIFNPFLFFRKGIVPFALSIFSFNVFSSPHIIQPKYDICYENRCLRISGKTAEISKLRGVMVIDKASFKTKNSKLIFLNDNSATKAEIDLKSNKVKIYGLQLSGKTIDLSVDAESDRIIRVLRSVAGIL